MDKSLRIQILLQAFDKATGPIRALGGTASKTGQALSAANKELAGLKKLDRQVARLKELRSGMQSTAGAVEAAKAKFAALRAEMQSAPTDKLSRQAAAARVQVDKLSEKLRAERREAHELSKTLRAAGVETKELGAAQYDLGRKTHAANQQIEQQKEKLKQIAARNAQFAKARATSGKISGAASAAGSAGVSATAGGVAIAAPVIAASQAAITFEGAMADVRKVINFPTPQAFGEMRDAMLDLSERVPITPDNLAAIAAAGARAGVARQELVAFTEDSAKMGVAFDVSAEEAGALMAKWRQSFGAGRAEVVALSDKINALTNAYGGNAAEVADMVTRIGPLAEVGGLASGEVAALSQVLNSIGVEAEVGATGIKNTILALAGAKPVTKASSAAFKQLGLDASDVAKRMQKDAGGTITDVFTRISKLSKDKQAGALTAIFGSESAAAIAPLLTSLPQVERALGLVGDKANYAGSMNAEFLNRIATSDGILGLTKNALQAVNIEMGTALLPTIKELAQWVKETASGWRAWTKEHPGAAKAIMLVAASVAGLLVAFGGLALAAAAVLGPFALLQLTLAQAGILFGPLGKTLGGFAGKALPLLGQALGIAGRAFVGFGLAVGRAGLALLANPITWIVIGIVAAVALLAGAAYLIYKNWKPIMAWLTEQWTKFKDFGAALVNGVIDGIRGALGRLKSAVVDVAGKASSWFKEKLGIHSPSRVFAGFGGNMMAGLTQGIDATAQRPLQRVRIAASSMTAAFAVGAAAAPAAAAPVRATAAAGGDTYHVHVYPSAGMDERALARLVRQELDREKSRARAASLSSFSDRGD